VFVIEKSIVKLKSDLASPHKLMKRFSKSSFIIPSPGVLKVGLEALNEHLPEIKAEVVYRERKLQFRPPIEELRCGYLHTYRFRVSMLIYLILTFIIYVLCLNAHFSPSYVNRPIWALCNMYYCL
jgi:hypothetical protein